MTAHLPLADRLAIALDNGHRRTVDLLPGDSGLATHSEISVPAAVLVAVTNRSEPGVILTQRPHTMRKHPGQVAFPGGRMEPDDASLVAAALREAQEEIGLAPELVTIIGTTDRYTTITGYEVTPVIAIVPAELQLQACSVEVADIFEVPLHFLLDPANHHVQEAEYKGATRRYFEIGWQGRRIWGATAAMIVNLSKRLQWPG